MTDALAQIAAWLNLAANALGKPLLAFVGVMPGWLSATLVSAPLGLVLLVVFKYTSNQRAIRRVRDDIKAHLLAIKLFPDSLWVTLCAQGRVLRGALLLLVLAIVPVLVMALPVTLFLGQLGLWYQSRPLRAGEEAVVTMTLNGAGPDWPAVSLAPSPGAQATIGPVRILSRRELCWNLRARENGYHRMEFLVDGQPVEKELAVGEAFMRTSVQRPGWQWPAILLNPAERPFPPASPVRAIQIDYPDRASWTSGTDWWMAYVFAASMVFALCFRSFIKVNL
ncbi:MAG: hypothetical protein NTV86_02515 [Planctomycetota bacterium]|nr:hypothetical protein [Planctomycetota bacterium]